jgi:hypothetical protein
METPAPDGMFTKEDNLQLGKNFTDDTEIGGNRLLNKNFGKDLQLLVTLRGPLCPRLPAGRFSVYSKTRNSPKNVFRQIVGSP